MILTIFYSNFKDMASHSDHDLWVKEQTFIAEEKKKFPDKFKVQRESRKALLERVGIHEKLLELPKGYVKYSPLDFIVEEILENGTVVTADTKEAGSDPALLGTGTIYADLIKVGISTLDAVDRIADALGVDVSKIGYAGLKDDIAITAQRISIEGSSLPAVRSLQIPRIMLKNIWEGSGKIKIGSLKGNRFNLFIRTKEELDEDLMASRIENINSNGVMNYFGLQRFGESRLLNHSFGLYMFRGDIRSLLETFLTGESSVETQYVAELRKRARKSFGNWKAMREIFEAMPYTFRIENALLDELSKIKDNKDYHKAFAAVSKQADLWAKSYGSYLANLIISKASLGEIKLGDKLPLVIARDKRAFSLYYPYLKQDRAINFLRNLRLFPFLHIANYVWIQSRIRPQFHGYKILPEGVALSFDLIKGAYATTVLMFLFDIVEGAPIPDWVRASDVDVKNVLNTGSISEIKDGLKVSIDRLLKARDQN